MLKLLQLLILEDKVSTFSNRSPYRIQCNNRSPYRIQCNSSSNRSPYRIQCNSSSNRSPYRYSVIVGYVTLVSQKDDKRISDPSPLSQTLWGSVNSLSTAPGNLLPASLSSVRTVLHFGSGRSGVATMTSTGGKKSLKASLQSSGSLTPVNPRYVLYVHIHNIDRWTGM